MKYLIAIAVLVLLFQKWGMGDAAAELNEKHGTDVIMYSASWCGYCKNARELLNSKDVAFKEFDIEQSSQANSEMKALGGRGVPVLLIQGEVVKGFNQGRILQLVQGL